MNVGKVKWFNYKKGYGFISQEGSDQDVFVHITTLHDCGLRGLKEDQVVEFEMSTDENGRASASKVQVKEE